MNWQLTGNKTWAALEAEFEVVRDMRGVPQDALHHAEGDVATHTAMVLAALENLPEWPQLPAQDREILRAAALLHDAEKRSTTREDENGRIISPGHARAGEQTVRQLLFQRAAPFAVREQIAALVRYHGLPLWLTEKPDPDRALFAASLRTDLRLLTLLARADILGRHCQDQAEMLMRTELFELYCREHDCFDHPKTFASDTGRFRYFHDERHTPDYQPYEPPGSRVIMLCGLPGMGKDHFIARHYPDLPVVSLDALRRQYNISPADKQAGGRVVQMAKEQAREYLRRQQDFVWNATSLHSSLRSQLITLFTNYHATVHLIYIEVPYAQWRQQNHQRRYAVPDNVLARMAAKLTVPAPEEAHQVSWYINGEWQAIRSPGPDFSPEPAG